ncbi:MAG: nuclear transport factor 2 family protein [Pseudoclavibacter sp.]|nr:nuclear transport factor 2 family protein [Pseudoclavibacter sp.]
MTAEETGGEEARGDGGARSPRELVLRFHRAWTGGDLDGAVALLDEGFRCRAPGRDIVGRSAYREYLAGFAQRLTGIEDIACLAEGERVALFSRPRTEHTATAVAGECFTVRDGRILESVLVFDRLSYAPQAG